MRTTPMSTLGSARNALRLLRMIGERGTISVSEAGRALGVGKSTAHRLLMTLVAGDFAMRDPATRRYYVGQEAVSAGLSSLWDYDVRNRTREPLRRLADSIGETTKLVVLDGPYGRVLEEASTGDSLRVGATLGKLLPANSTAGGKVLLAHLAEEKLRQLFHGGLPTVTQHTIAEWDSLEVELQKVRSRGWAVSEGESTHRVNGIAVPVRNAAGQTVGALAVAAPEQRMSRTMRLEILGQLLQASRVLSLQLAPTIRSITDREITPQQLRNMHVAAGSETGSRQPMRQSA